MFFEGKEIYIIKPIFKKIKVVLEDESFFYYLEKDKINKINKKNLIFFCFYGNRKFYFKGDNLLTFKSRFKKIHKYF